ncbi:hypothetical protein BD311DRAFT_658003 [Dichomitus squalens]|uniref:DUF6534 domain-containing protein n=1 Tax=Dichomitus squalens TaxID=114155 RepID=A0A4Q9MT70_9APHY|nr:hypothetical protein BD311DRAFT_658003 [Dichomitus squalens]
MATLYHSSGAILLGGLVALFLSGAVLMQVVLYSRVYTSDPIKTKAMVIFIWVLDLTHSMMVCIANWQNLVVNFGMFDNLDHITWWVKRPCLLWLPTEPHVYRSPQYLLWRCQLGHNRSHRTTGNLLILLIFRIRLRSFEQFVKRFGLQYVFTLGLSTSTSLDIVITGTLCLYLRRRRSGMAKMDRIISVLTLYTVENGMLTCVTTAISLVCWLKMSNNLIFLGLHLAIGKLYANSIMASLNARKSLSNRLESSGNSDGYPLPVVFPSSSYSPRSPTAPWEVSSGSPHQKPHRL